MQVILLQSSFGWLIRSIHRWSSAIMALFIILHVGRVYFTGGFKKPREVTWISGLVLALITFAFGVTGYSLPWDRIALEIVYTGLFTNSCLSHILLGM